jgi:hypothetical protein
MSESVDAADAVEALECILVEPAPLSWILACFSTDDLDTTYLEDPEVEVVA